MTAETPTPDNGNQIANAIRRLAGTMRGEAGDEARGVAAGAPENPYEASSPPSVRSNEIIEDTLVYEKTFSRRSMLQRQVLGCLGCKLATQPGSNGTVTVSEIAACTDSHNKPIQEVLKRIKDGGYVDSKIRKDLPFNGRPPVHFSLTQEGNRKRFRELLEIPRVCGLEGDNSRTLNATGEEKLIRARILDKRGSLPRAILECLSCQSEQNEGVYVTGLMRCQGTQHASTLGMLKRLVEGGVLEAETEERTGSTQPRTFYTLSGSPLATSIGETLETPDRCGLRNPKL